MQNKMSILTLKQQNTVTKKTPRTWLVHISNTVSLPNIDNIRQPDRNETALYWKSTGLQWNNLASKSIILVNQSV